MKLAWSDLAKQQLREVRRFSIERWGRPAALRYLEDIRDAAKRLAANPALARSLRDRLRILRVRSHYMIVYVDEPADKLIVARLLHVARDIERHLDGN